MKNPLFTGVCTALVTPFLDGAVNYPMMEQLLRRQLDAGVKAVVIAGTTGESATLTDSEKLTLIRRAKKFVGDDCRIIAGTGSNSTAHAVNLSLAAQEMGADGLLVVTPYYNKANAEGLLRHYQAVAGAVDLPLIAYNVPSRTGVDIPVSLYRRLASISNLVGVKEACGDISKIARIRHNCPDSFCIWSGNDDQTVAVMALGGRGIISVLANIWPERMIAMTNAAQSGDYATAGRLQAELMPMIDLLFSDVNPIPVKKALQLLGYDVGSCRLPLTELDSTIIPKLAAHLL